MAVYNEKSRNCMLCDNDLGGGSEGGEGQKSCAQMADVGAACPKNGFMQTAGTWVEKYLPPLKGIYLTGNKE